MNAPVDYEALQARLAEVEAERDDARRLGVDAVERAELQRELREVEVAEIKRLRGELDRQALGTKSHADCVGELAEALGWSDGCGYGPNWWAELLRIVRERLDAPLMERLKKITKREGKPDEQLLDELRWLATVLTPERNRLMEQRRQLLQLFPSANVNTIVECAERLVAEREEALRGRRNAEELVRRLRDGMRAWARDEDGVHFEAWDAYADACVALGEPRPTNEDPA